MTEKQSDDENSAYDSMIENGTSDEDSGSEEGEQQEHAVQPKSQPKQTKRKAEVGAAGHAATTTTTAKKQKPTEKVKAPTLVEINELKETQNLFHSNLFRLQVKEMLAELKLKEKYKNYTHTWMEQFKQFLKSVQSEADKVEVTPQLPWLLRSHVRVPLSLDILRAHPHKAFQFQFIKPAVEPQLIGAAVTHTLLGPKINVDVNVTMPAACFQKENYLNLAYDQKRALYLTYIANQMLKSKHFPALTLNQLRFNYYANNPLKPVLELTPPESVGSLSKKLVFRVFVSAAENSFKLSRFVPWTSNIRTSIFNEDSEEDSVPFATPNYNAGVLFDLTMQRNQTLLSEVFENQKNFQEGLLLLKVWLRQRQLSAGFSAFNAHILGMFMVFLSKQRKLYANMSSYQVARTVWNQLAHSNWDENEKGISLCTSQTLASNQPTLEQFHTYYDLVFIDATGFYNICANVSLEIYRRVRLEAKLAVDMLNDMKLNSFQLIFMTKFPLYSQFDHMLKINKKDTIEQILEMHVQPADKVNYAGNAYPLLLRTVSSLLRKGLKERALALLPVEQLSTPWSADEPAPNTPQHLHLGIVLNPEHAFEVLNKGPESIADDADEFRRFWGDKTQLRRFQDGTITESVVWGASTDALAKKRVIVRAIVLHLLQHHFQLEEKDLDYVAGEFDVVYKLTPSFKTDKLYERYKIEQDTDAEMLSLQVIRSFDDLARKLHGLTELPLEIVSIAGISPVFRYCESEPLLPQARFINEQFFAPNVQRGVIQLGLSGKWPSELAALRALKTAFYLQIAKLLHEKYKLRSKVTYDGILVLKQGYCFALEIAHPKEVTLLKAKVVAGVTQHVDCEASMALEKRHYILPKVTGALHALYQQHNSFGPTVMIAKRWLHAQLIDGGMWPSECTELLIASQYLSASAQHAPCSPQTGFIRFLKLLAYTDWKAELVLLNFNNAMNDNEISALEQRFNAERGTFPPLCIVTGYDQKHGGSLWSTQEQPNLHVLTRVTVLARQALAIVEEALLSSSEPFIKPSKLFIPSSQGYDLVIQLKPENVSNTLACEFGSPFTAFTKPNWRLPLADTDFLKEAVDKLREAYSDFAAFFYNPSGGKVITVVWKPAETFAKRSFKINEINGCALTDDATKVQCRKEILIEDFKFILKDFYLRMGSVESVLKASSSNNASGRPTTAKRYFDSPAAEKAFSRSSKQNGTKVTKTEVKTKSETKSLKGVKAKIVKVKNIPNLSTKRKLNKKFKKL